MVFYTEVVLIYSPGETDSRVWRLNKKCNNSSFVSWWQWVAVASSLSGYVRFKSFNLIMSTILSINVYGVFSSGVTHNTTWWWKVVLQGRIKWSHRLTHKYWSACLSLNPFLLPHGINIPVIGGKGEWKMIQTASEQLFNFFLNLHAFDWKSPLWYNPNFSGFS